MSDQEEEFKAKKDELLGKLDIVAFLENKGTRSGQITIYTDEQAGLELGTAKDVTNQIGLTIGREQTGVLGEIDKLDEKSETYQKGLKALEKKRDAILERIRESGLTFHITAVPPFVAQSHQNQARRELGFKGKLSEEQQKQVDDVASDILFSDVITSIVSADGASSGSITKEQAKALRERLPRSEKARLDYKIIDLQFSESFDQSVASDSDF